MSFIYLNVAALFSLCAVFSSNTEAFPFWNFSIINLYLSLAMTMAFLDVRLKKYIEIRFADSMPMEYMLAYATFIKGLFINEENIKHILEKYKIHDKDLSMAENNLKMNGFSGEVYGQNVCDLARELLDIAKSSVQIEEQSYLEPFYNIIDSKKTLAERWCV